MQKAMERRAKVHKLHLKQNKNITGSSQDQQDSSACATEKSGEIQTRTYSPAAKNVTSGVGDQVLSIISDDETANGKNFSPQNTSK